MHCDRNLYQRVFQFTNDHTGFDLDTPGQEDFTVIQYNVSDEYTYIALSTLTDWYVITLDRIAMELVMERCIRPVDAWQRLWSIAR